MAATAAIAAAAAVDATDATDVTAAAAGAGGEGGLADEAAGEDIFGGHDVVILGSAFGDQICVTCTCEKRSWESCKLEDF